MSIYQVPNFGLGALRLTLPITNDWIGTTPSGFVEGLAGPSTQGLTQFSVQKVTICCTINQVRVLKVGESHAETDHSIT